MPGQDLVLWDGGSTAADAWRSNAANGSSAALSVDASGTTKALRLDFTLSGHGAWVIVRRDFPASLPSHYAVRMRVRGTGAPVELQLKLIDPSGTNVWWWRRPAFEFPPDTRLLTLHKASLEFAWGPVSGGEPERIGAIELALASDAGSAGTLWLEDLRIEARDPAATQAHVSAVSASSVAPGSAPACVLDGDPHTHWRPAANDLDPWIRLDLGRTAEWGGFIVDCDGAAPAARLLVSDDDVHWLPVAESPGGARRVWLRAEGEGRFARITFASNAAAITRVGVVPIELAVSRARYAGARARQSPRGRFPRHVLGEQIYWAVVSADGDDRKGLLSEDGALEVGVESFTLEPSLWADGHWITWSDVKTRLTLADDHLPLPSVEWSADALRLHVSAFATEPAGQSALLARYEVGNDGTVERAVRLFVAIRPYQVNPSWQSLNLVGGVASIVRLKRADRHVRVNGEHDVIAISPPDAFGAAGSDVGLERLSNGELPAGDSIEDPIGFAEGVLAFDLTLGPGARETIILAVPLHPETPAPPVVTNRAAAASWADERWHETLAHWRARLSGLPIDLPPAAKSFSDSLRASLGWILANRDGPRIQPGPRCYRRSWIRDGTLTGTALVEMGLADEARTFLRWYAPYQLDDGRVPCAVDHRGIDLAVEHDSHGELIWGIIEVFRLTGDREFLEELWPNALRAVDAIAALRAQRTGDQYRGDARFGLLPESISHEGYASHPVHAYWDDFFAVRALADAADAAALLGDRVALERLVPLRDGMRRDLHASIVRTIADHHLDVLPGSAELGDFDPTSSAIAFDPCAEAHRLPPEVVAHTFERYWSELETRRNGSTKAEAYTPYEVRIAAALLMLGQRQRARELLDWLIADQRPNVWRQWPEIAWRDSRAPRFFGDLPHGWVASTFVRAVRRMIAYERAADGAVVIGAGIPLDWVRDSAGVVVRGLPTHFGRLSFTLRALDEQRVHLSLRGSNLQAPGGIVVLSPFAQPLRAASADGQPLPLASPDHVTLKEPVEELVLEI